MKFKNVFNFTAYNYNAKNNILSSNFYFEDYTILIEIELFHYPSHFNNIFS